MHISRVSAARTNDGVTSTAGHFTVTDPPPPAPPADHEQSHAPSLDGERRAARVALPPETSDI